MRPRWNRTLAAAVAAGGMLAALAIGGPAAAVNVQHPTGVGENPANFTPHVLDGRVLAIVQVGGRMVVGGQFTKIAAASAPTVPVARGNVFAFNAATGTLDPGFRPAVDGPVETLTAGADGASVYVGGQFNTVNGAAQKSLARLRVADGTRDPGFKARTNGRVKDMTVANGRLVVGGTFTTVNGIPRGHLAAVDPATGALSAELALSFTGPRRGTVKVDKFDVTPDGRLAVVIGNFTYVNGLRRDQIAVVNLQTSPASVNGWATTRYAPACASVFNSYLHDVDLSSDGRWFVVVTTGGSFPAPSLCDTAARWPLTSATAGRQPAWVNYTGGDTLWSVAITGPAVYVGGHQRWHNSPARVTREGIAALDPVTGLALPWNPGRSRGVGAFALYSTPAGLWVGSDTSRIGGETHRRLALMPLP